MPAAREDKNGGLKGFVELALMHLWGCAPTARRPPRVLIDDGATSRHRGLAEATVASLIAAELESRAKLPGRDLGAGLRMGLIEEEVVAAVAVTAAAVSPRARKLARKGAVYGLAGMLKAGDVAVAAARGAARGAQSERTAAPEPVKSPQAGRRTPRSGQTRAAQSASGSGDGAGG